MPSHMQDVTSVLASVRWAASRQSLPLSGSRTCSLRLVLPAFCHRPCGLFLGVTPGGAVVTWSRLFKPLVTQQQAAETNPDKTVPTACSYCCSLSPGVTHGGVVVMLSRLLRVSVHARWPSSTACRRWRTSVACASRAAHATRTWPSPWVSPATWRYRLGASWCKDTAAL